MGYWGVLMVFCLVAITLYMAFAFPFTLFHLKQSETTEIQSVIIVARSGEKSPTAESYFVGEEPPEELFGFGYEQLTNTGKERMYLLGKFLKLRYYQLLLNGNPRKIYARSADSDRSLESAQALLAGLNPPKESWLWSSTGEMDNWQPKAVHTAPAANDDLLAPVEPNCPRLNEADKARWKNSSRYQQLVNEFRHDLQTLRSNTGLEFEDDLEMLANIEDSLKTRKAFRKNIVPNWYTPTFANRLAHIADVSAESRFSPPEVQRIYVGRLLYEINERIRAKIRLNQQVLAAEGEFGLEPELLTPKQEEQLDQQQQQQLQAGNRIKVSQQTEPNMLIYLTDKNRLSALMNSLQIYSSQPYFGSLLLIELHYDPVNQLHFLRLFTVASLSPNVFPEPVRVNPIACLDSPECEPQQFEQNIRHLMLDADSWQEACTNLHGPEEIPPDSSSTAPILMPVNRPDKQPEEQRPTSTTISPSSIELPEDERLDEGLIVGPTSATSTTASPSINATGEPESDDNSSTTSTTSALISPSPGSDSVVLKNSSSSSSLDNKSAKFVSEHLKWVDNGFVVSQLDANPQDQKNHQDSSFRTRDIYYPENNL